MISVDVNKQIGKRVFHYKFEIPSAMFLGVFGASGSGKTTLLRMLAGLVIPDSGWIKIGEEVWFDSDRNINLPPQKRSVAMVFQDYQLFENMTVIEMLNFAASKRMTSSEINNLLDSLMLTGTQKSCSSELSGGQKQRISLLMALVRAPKVLLLDEPFSALDTTTKKIVQKFLEKYCSENKIATFFVSHDIQDVIKVTDQLALVKNGEMSDVGNPVDVLLPKEKSTVRVFVLEKGDDYLIGLVGKELVKLSVNSKLIKLAKEGEEFELILSL